MASKALELLEPPPPPPPPTPTVTFLVKHKSIEGGKRIASKRIKV